MKSYLQLEATGSTPELTSTEDLIMVLNEVGNTPLNSNCVIENHHQDQFAHLKLVLGTLLDLILVQDRNVRIALKSLLEKAMR